MIFVHYLLFVPFHISSTEIEKAAKVRKFKDFHESVRCSATIVSTWLDIYNRIGQSPYRALHRETID